MANNNFMKKRIYLLLAGCFLSFPIVANCIKSENYPNTAECSYEAFKVLLSCKHNAAVLSIAENVGEDNGNKNTSSRNYKLDETASALNCQQKTSARYASVNSDYDVGHLTAIDLFDYDKTIALQTNVMTNMIPQASSFNRSGSWKRTETLAECYRDEEGYAPIQVLSGVIFGNDTTNDLFSVSHDLPSTPDYLWKLIYSESMGIYDAWVMPNANTSKASTLHSSRRTLISLITLLNAQNDSAYKPTLDFLKKIQNTKPVFKELNWNARCHQRRG